MIDAEAAVAVVLVARMPAPLRGERERSYAPATSIQSDDLKISWEESARARAQPSSPYWQCWHTYRYKYRVCFKF